MSVDDVRAAALIPAFGCAPTIAGVVAGSRRQVPVAIVVDDGSRDRTAELAMSAGAEVIRRSSNGGKGRAIRDGLKRILGDSSTTHVIFLDADGQHDPDELPKFLDAARRGESFIIGSRMADATAMPTYRYETNRIGDRILSRMTGLEVEDGQSGFRCIATSILRRIELHSDGYLIENEMLLKAAPLIDRIASVPIRAIYGAPSHYRPFRDTWNVSWGSVFVKLFET
jgi:glycosyltransferase involved in cell wall biosynthesis